MEECRTV